ncbi:LysR substrate-binding domain-containing protein [Lichenibacterium ramalinae]|uniref:LysR family transcriptional regulator n=1 Tax=Lichenibacterium ramalinae TaxID=2316527 RepID=A0A4V1RI45_9HYPH|nr:LysR substrate-binding domain-containing protein [Lichenibacterium ramalinae]RYB02277.1 LysR family transcriptional regulator [Lichenibacterium ramalinae]
MASIDIANAATLDLDLLRTFVAVVDAGGFTRAAERVHRTQSTVSQQIRKLEDDLGRRLIDRAGAVPSVTEEGEMLLGYARRLLAIAAEARDALREPGLRPVLRLGVPEDFAGRRLTDLLSGFARACPELRLDTTSGWSVELRRLLEAGDLDLSLIKREAGEGPCLARWPERLAWVSGRDADLGADPVPLALFPQGCVYRARAIAAVEARGRRWRVAFVGQGLAGVQAAVASGLGIGLLPTDAVVATHRRLDSAQGFADPEPTELALVARGGRPPDVAGRLARFLADGVGSLLRP